MQKITRQPLLRRIAVFFHPRFIRMENRRINKRIFAQKQAELAALGVHLEEHPEDYSRAGLFDAPFAGR